LDNLTHTLTAVALSQAGLNRKTRFATLAVIAGANLPDIDVVTWADSTATYLKYHRGITHSLLGVVVLGILAGVLLYYAGRRARPGRAGSHADARWLVVCGLVGTGSHLLLDFTNAYGVRPFLPFSGRWYAWDIMFILDPVLLLLLMVGLAFPALLRLVSEEVGARQPAYRAGAIFALCAMAALWALRDFSHRRVLTLLDSHLYGQENPRRLGAYPAPANPLAWVGVIETDSAFHVVPVSALDDRIDADEARVFRKPDPTPALEAAMRTRTGAIFLDFAEFPWGHARESEQGFDVSLRDLRFFSPMSERRGFVMDVKLDRDLRVRSERFSFSSPPRRESLQEPIEGEERGVSFESAGTGREARRR
jgi:inner membrane protein